MMATGSAQENILEGRRVLIVEDRYMIASELAEEVARLGGQVLGPSRSVADAEVLLKGADADLAILDVNLDGELVFPLAETLVTRAVPFIFLTGYDEAVLPRTWRDRPILEKPLNSRALHDELIKLV